MTDRRSIGQADGHLAAVCLGVRLCAILAWIKIRGGIIPDWLNLMIAAPGAAWIPVSADLAAARQALDEGIVIGGAFLLLRRLYFVYRGIQGLGLGDAKFSATARIWVGVTCIPIVLLIGTVTTLICAGAMQLSGRALTERTSLSFEPFLTAGLA